LKPALAGRRSSQRIKEKKADASIVRMGKKKSKKYGKGCGGKTVWALSGGLGQGGVKDAEGEVKRRGRLG